MRRIVVAALVLVACRKDEPVPRDRAGASVDPAPVAVTHDDPCAKAAREGDGPLAWIKDDYAGALACARARKVPLVLDLWAPWCHTCLSMQTTVFTDASFAADGKRFVFASLDTDRDGNAAAVAKFALSAWPTFYVVGADETVLARFVGGASLAQFHAFLDAGARQGGAQPWDLHLVTAERALATKDHATAITELTAALAAAPADWVRRPDALVSLELAKLKAGDVAGCLDVAEASIDQTGNAAAASDFLVAAMECAKQRDKAEPARVAKLRDRAIARWQALLADPKAQLSIDDRSDAMASLRESLDDLGKHDDARAIADKQRAMLDDAAAKAGSPMAAMTYNWHRAEVYTYLGRGLDIVPALEKSAADLPGEYDPRARLGWVYMKANKLPEAARWLDAALALMYGPRKARYLGLRADVAKEMGDAEGEKRFRDQAAQIVAAREKIEGAGSGKK